MPLPENDPDVSMMKWPVESRLNTGGGAPVIVFAPRPASRLPFEAHMRRSPLPTVKTRDWLTFTLSSTTTEMSPPAPVTMPRLLAAFWFGPATRVPTSTTAARRHDVDGTVLKRVDLA